MYVELEDGRTVWLTGDALIAHLISEIQALRSELSGDRIVQAIREYERRVG